MNLPEHRDHLAISEAGRELSYYDSEVKAALQTLALAGGKYKRAEKILKQEGINIPWTTLRHWKDSVFKRRYYQTRKELSRDIGEEAAGRAMERALEADDAERLFLEQAQKKAAKVDPNHLAKSVASLSQAKSNNIEKAQLLRGQPTSIEAVDIAASIEVLERLGVAEKAIDVESEEIA